MSRSARRSVRGRLLIAASGAIAILISAPSGSGAQDRVVSAGGQKIVVPAATPLQHWRPLSQPGMNGARFAGQASLTGTLYYYGPAPNAGDPSVTDPGAVLFEPDKASAARLPYLKGDGKPPGSFDLKLEIAGEAAALPVPLRKAADASKGKRIAAGPASLHVTGYLLFEDGCGVNEYQFEGETIDHAGPMRLIAPQRRNDHEGEDC